MHPPIELVKSSNFLYVHEHIVTTWLQSNHVGYKSTTININDLNMLPNNNILDHILRSIFKSTNIELANVEHRTNITNLHKQMNKCKKIKQTN
jgi:hypothetical protein